MNIWLMENKRRIFSLVLWTLIISVVGIVGQAFYPALVGSKAIQGLETFMNTPLMNNMMGAFGADIVSLSSYLGFYVTYNSIYTALLGCIFAVLLSSSILAGEEQGKTADFLLTRPISRGHIYASKALVVLTQIIILSIGVYAAGIIALESFKEHAPDKIFLTKQRAEHLTEQFYKQPEEFRNFFQLTPEKAIQLTGTDSFEKQQLNQNPKAYVTLFKQHPRPFIELFLKKDSLNVEQLIKDFSLNKSVTSGLIGKYSLRKYTIIAIYNFLLMISMATIIYMLAAIFKRGKSVMPTSIAIVFGAYFLDAISKITPKSNWFGYISPFKFVNTDVLNPNYGLEVWRVGYFITVSLLCLCAGYLRYRKKDIIL